MSCTQRPPSMAEVLEPGDFCPMQDSSNGLCPGAPHKPGWDFSELHWNSWLFLYWYTPFSFLSIHSCQACRMVWGSANLYLLLLFIIYIASPKTSCIFTPILLWHLDMNWQQLEDPQSLWHSLPDVVYSVFNYPKHPPLWVAVRKSLACLLPFSQVPRRKAWRWSR